ncbi:uncharacterized protein LOC113552077 isoform X1 [Rhopalosiphum maidis]|uniref:uncharacterized protein LOC113552077 isoform X1 n=2 Tax=Rhopalosiphum maidis TaxID=43146 RepID=UPI000F0040C7|nr:uncharacterized protein LOC113552077 isoform X1 [Rhopalosiphum maidis]XP_026810549.1 uncharacterized protein LOC113552077 isoform X1 [Rhopalosiphum maidis]
MRKLPMNVFILFLLVAKLYHQADSKDIILEDEEDVIISIYFTSNLNVKCGYSGDFKTNSFEWKKIYNNNKWMNSEKKLNVISRSQWLKFENVNDFDSGQYYCLKKGTNSTGTFYEKRGFVLDMSLTVDKNSKVKFQKNFTENVPLLVNRTLHLSCPFRSSSDTEFSWYKDGNLLVKRKAILEGVQFIDNYYTSKSVRLSDAGNYKCVVKNSKGSIQFKFNVGVYEDANKLPPSLDYPQDLLLKTGMVGKFSCNAFDYYPGWEISWYYTNDTNLMDMDIKSVDFSKFKKLKNNFDITLDNHELIIDSVTIHNVGWYICVAPGIPNHVMAEAKLDLEKKIEMCPPLESDSLDIKCTLNGKNTNCSNPSLPKTIAKPLCKPTYIVPKGQEATPNELLCQSNGMWNNNLYNTCIQNCGRIHVKHQGGNGEKASIGTTPWNVIIYRFNTSTSKYKLKCTGSIITQNLVISAAHCFWKKGMSKNITITDGEYKIAVGKYDRNFTLIHNNSTEIVDAKMIYVDEKYYGAEGFYAQDIAVIVLAKKVSFSKVVEPVCIDWDYKYNIENGAQGKIVIWEIELNGKISNPVLLEVSLPYIDLSSCRNMYNGFEIFLFGDKFCAGSTLVSGHGIALGDSGAGLTFLQSSYHYLTGIASLRNPESNNSVSAFTDLKPHIQWIRKLYDTYSS